jgi:arylsulfatase A-like enzyme
MQVPFMLYHSNLKPKQIEHSCHFDLFPTFFDLLGIECQYATHGRSLAHDDRAFAYFFHSATLKGNSPANFGFLHDDKMVWMDRLFNQVNTLQNGHGKIKTHDKEYVKTMLYRMLKSREILA